MLLIQVGGRNSLTLGCQCPLSFVSQKGARLTSLRTQQFHSSFKKSDLGSSGIFCESRSGHRLFHLRSFRPTALCHYDFKLGQELFLPHLFPIFCLSIPLSDDIQGVTGGTDQIREGVPYVKLYRYNSKHLCPKLNVYGDNGKRSLKL